MSRKLTSKEAMRITNLRDDLKQLIEQCCKLTYDMNFRDGSRDVCSDMEDVFIELKKLEEEHIALWADAIERRKSRALVSNG